MTDRKKIVKELVDYLHAQPTAVLSTLSPDGAPQAATVFFWVEEAKDGDVLLYFVTRRNSRKFSNLLHDDRVALVIGSELRPVSVQAEGKAELVETAKGFSDLEQAVVRLTGKPHVGRVYSGAFFPANPFGRVEGDDFAVFRVRPHWLRWMRLEGDAHDLAFHQIIG